MTKDVQLEKLDMEAKPYDKVLEKVMELCPAAVQNGKVDFERLKAELSDVVDEDAKETYEFKWVGKNKALVEANKPIRKTLRPCKEESKNWDTTENLYIEGDNLEALKLLQEGYLGQIKMIYIDPPYNTGSDFVYHDNRVQSEEEMNEGIGLFDEEGNRQLSTSFVKNTETSGRFHSDWCTMMYPRLKLARDLLSDDGSIFISIDYNEIANLKKLMDEIFGEDNFQREIIWRIGWLSGYKTTAPNFIRNHDTILFYSKNQSNLDFVKKYIENKDFKPLVKKDAKLTDKLVSLGLNDIQQKDLLQFINHGNRPEKYPLEDTWNSNEYDDLNSIAIVSFSGEKISKILNVDQDFKGQKALKMLIRILEATTKKEDIVLDFFSGTASTAHAVMQLNTEDGGRRKFIMVQLPEVCDEKSEAFKAGYKNICEIGKERIRRAGDKIVQETGKKDLDIGFRVLKVDETNMQDVYYNPAELTQKTLLSSIDNIKTDRQPLDLLFGVMVDWGVPLTLPLQEVKVGTNTIHVVGDNDLVACFDNNVTTETITKMAELTPTRAVFRDACFAKDDAKINMFEIFKTICHWDDKKAKDNIRVM